MCIISGWSTAISQGAVGCWSFALDSSGNVIAGVWPGGMIRSSDGGNSWESIGLDTIGNEIEAIAVHPNGYIFAGPYGMDGLYRSTDNGVNWTYINIQGTYAINAFAVTQSGYVLAGTADDLIFRSTDLGIAWNRIYSSPLRTLSFVFGNSENLFVGHLFGISRSSDEGTTWQRVYSTDGSCYALARSPNGYLFGAITVGSVHTVVRSTDTGATWNTSGSGLPLYNFVSLIVHPSGNVFVGAWYGGGGGGVYRSTNNGDSWMLSGLEDESVWDLIVDHVGNIIAGGNSGIFKSMNNGDTWARTFTITSVKQGETLIPEDFVFHQNFPNPFNPSTHFEFSVLQSVKVKLGVYNVLGQEVAVLFNDIAHAGKLYRLTFDAAGLATGIYIARLQSESRTEMRKMVLLR